ncbi:MAG: PPOX class F420-dependent oxidoreductase [Dehalococcoidia bacterium]|nr:MAG: PPOX class F420-dependent oxidoreductase [Dehalococcoidia bacterium]
MSVYTERELEFLRSQPLGRLATVGRDGQPHVSPVRFRIDPANGAIEIGGRNLSSTKKWRDVERTGRAAFVVDDILPPRHPRGVEIRGPAEAVVRDGEELIRITPRRIAGWGIDTDSYSAHIRTVGGHHETPPRIDAGRE